MTSSGGKTAGINGKYFENKIAFFLEVLGYKRLKNGKDPIKKPYFYEQNSKFRSLYNKPWRMDIIVYHPTKFPNLCAVELKYQKVSGSVDEKFPYVVAGLKQLPCNSILLLGGGGYKPESVYWAIQQETSYFKVYEFGNNEEYLRRFISHIFGNGPAIENDRPMYDLL